MTIVKSGRQAEQVYGKERRRHERDDHETHDVADALPVVNVGRRAHEEARTRFVELLLDLLLLRSPPTKPPAQTALAAFFRTSAFARRK